ncbi:MAG: hypothetical protein ACLQNE_33260 [Thermoguttaceae bacterium]
MKKHPALAADGIIQLAAHEAKGQVAMNDHPNNHIRGAVDYALDRGWRLRKCGPRAHAWGRMYCPAGQRGGCMFSVASTPKNPQNHAAWIRRQVDACEH